MRLLANLMFAGGFAVGASAPVDDFCFIDREARVVGCGEAWFMTGRAIDVRGFSATATNHMVVVVTDSVFVQCRGSSWLDASDQVFFR